MAEIGFSREHYQRFLCKDKIEVRSVEDGFLGSWHAGEVIACKARILHVKYDHILVEDESENLVEEVLVSKLMDDIDYRKGNQLSYRGHIRPLPPLVKFDQWNLFYGLCVDVFYNESWWEGVVFDHEDGANMRQIFFPDLGDEMNVGINNLRLTLDWDQVSCSWRHRGYWVFLELIEEYEQELPLFVSVKQIWYDVRSKECFDKKIKEWTFMEKDSWKELVLETIKDNLNLTIDEIIQPILSYAEGLEENMFPASGFGDSLVPLAIETPFDCDTAMDNEIEINLLNDSVPTPQTLLVLPSNQDRYAENCDFNGDGIAANSDKINGRPTSSNLNATVNWLTAGQDILPEALSKYTIASACGKRPEALKKHLAYLGCKLERVKGGRTIRYISPTKKIFYSLVQVRKFFEENPTEIPQDEQRDLRALPCESNSQPIGQYGACTRSEELVVVPKYCPKAVSDYSKLGVEAQGRSKIVEDLREKAKQHLAAVGWVFRCFYNGRRCDLRYTSPRGKTYGSLSKACKGYLKEELNKSSDTGSEDCEGSLAVDKSSTSHKPKTILSWLIDNNVILPREKVYYCGRKNGASIGKGQITRDGIKCSCCTKVFTISHFEVHVGSSSGSSAANIYLKDGRSLLDCQIQILRKNKRSIRDQPDRLNGTRLQHDNDYICSVCHYGGELILCDQCPSSFHKSCLGLKDVPDGDWFCPSCCCGICCQNKLVKVSEHLTDDTVLICSQCEHIYHVECLKRRGVFHLARYPKDNWFCSKKCEQICLGLLEILGKRNSVGVDDLSWTLLKSVKSDRHDLDVPDTNAETECKSRLHVALEVMHEVFMPVKEDMRDIAEDVMFSRRSTLKRLDFHGFYTILLEKNDELITVANVRIYGEKVAEVPMVGTRFHYRRVGMCRILMNELEKKLGELGVQRLVLPAVPSVLNAWTTSFGFSQMTASERLKYLDCTFLVFPGTIMCQKLLINKPSAQSSLSRGSQHKLGDDGKRSGDNIDFDQFSPVSEVFQVEHFEESGAKDQKLVEVTEVDGSTPVREPVPPVNMASSRHMAEGAHHNKEVGSSSRRYLKYYYKRRISAIVS